MSDVILTLNAGSSSLKFAVYPITELTPEVGCDQDKLISGQVTNIHHQPVLKIQNMSDQPETCHEWTLEKNGHHACLIAALKVIRSALPDKKLAAVGHRVVHGGAEFAIPVHVTAAVKEKLAALSSMAPQHQPYNLAAMDTIEQNWPGIVQIASFDTGFHQTQPDIAQIFALPKALTESGIKRYGFHGLSYDYTASQLPKLTSREKRDRVIVAHLGSGASLCALRGGQSIASTMGFSALDGLPMATRCGDLDPGVIFYLAWQKQMGLEEIEHLLYEQSGLLGISGISKNINTLLASAQKPAKQAIEYFCYRAQREIGSLITALGGLDTLIFTAGIGENVPEIRSKICTGIEWLGLQLDDDANVQNKLKISDEESQIEVFVVPTDEEAVLYRDALSVLNR